MSRSDAPKNRLANETSPYLLQHAANPVDWYPWGEEALERARSEEKPIFLSIGYAACHWCHVMERESFEDEGIASILNQHFVPVKVDREERPDLDEVYMQAVQLMTGRGGWPMSVWLTPDLRPFYGGTYFPPEDHGTMPGFRRVLERLAEMWREQRDDLIEPASRMGMALASLGRVESAPGEPTADLIGEAARELAAHFDSEWGGFSGAPKFPHADSIQLLLRHHHRSGDGSARSMALHTLDRMASGGIHDHLAGGFHRYSVDREWLVPHFEKMLYDQALLLHAYLDAWETTAEERWANVARGISDWVLADMTDEHGGFHSTLDADSEGVEGKYYVWDPVEVDETLGDGAALFREHYGVHGLPNFEGRWILHVAAPIERIAREGGGDAAELRERIDRSRRRLLEIRACRIPPAKDDKVLSGWNGLMIAALARAAVLLPEERYLDAASRAAGFVLTEMRPDGRLLRSWRGGEAQIPAFLEDHAYLLEGLVELHEASEEARWLDEARAIADEMLRLFHDRENGGFFFTGSDQDAALVRTKMSFDGATPSGNSAACGALVRLAARTGDDRYRDAAVETLSLFHGNMGRAPTAHCTMLLALDRLLAAGEDAPRGKDAEILHLAAAAPESVTAGDTLEVRLMARLAEGWHVPANDPGEGRLLGTRLELEPSAGFTLDCSEHPSGDEMHLGSVDGPVRVLHGEFEVTARVRVSPDLPPGPRQMTLHLHYQACGDTRCLRPARASASLSVKILPGGS